MDKLDFSAFSSPDFDPVDWINDLLAQPRTQNESLLCFALISAPQMIPQQFVSNVRMKIQVVSLGLINSLDDLSAQCVARIPRVLRDIEQLRKDVIHLRSRINEQEALISVIEGDAALSIADLAELDQMKIRIAEISKIVGEVDRFKNLVKTLEAQTGEKDTRVLAAALQEINQSYEVLKDIPEFRNYKITIAMLVERLESEIRPKLIQAFNQHLPEQAAEYIKIFRQIGRLDEVFSLYYKCRSVAIVQMWKEFDPPVPASSVPGAPKPSPAVPLYKWLPNFYSELLMLLNTEAPALLSVFPEPSVAIVGLLEEILKAMNENFDSRLIPLPLDQVIMAYKATKSFAENARGYLESCSQGKKYQIVSAVFKAYRPLQTRYAVMEKAFLSRDASSLKPPKGDFIATITSINESLPKVLLLAEAATQRCMDFTMLTEAEALVSVIQNIFDEYLSHLKSLIVHLRGLAGLDPAQPSEAIKKKLMSSEGELFHDWKESFFQGGLQLLEVVHKLEKRIDSFCESFRSKLLNQISKLFIANAANPKADPELVITVDPILQADLTKANKLYRFLFSFEDDATKLIPSSRRLVQDLIGASQRLVFDSMFSYVRDKLAYVPSFEEWAKETHGNIVLSFSISPQMYIKLIVEHLLVLPQVLEPYDQNTALEKIAVDVLRRDTNQLQHDDDNGEGSSNHTDQQHRGYASQWISEVCRATQHLYLQKIFEIPRLSPNGSAQLAADLTHLFNVFGVLGISPIRPLDVVHRCLRTPESQYQTVLEHFTKENEQILAERVKKLRKL